MLHQILHYAGSIEVTGFLLFACAGLTWLVMLHRAR